MTAEPKPNMHSVIFYYIATLLFYMLIKKQFFVKKIHSQIQNQLFDLITHTMHRRQKKRHEERKE